MVFVIPEYKAWVIYLEGRKGGRKEGNQKSSKRGQKSSDNKQRCIVHNVKKDWAKYREQRNTVNNLVRNAKINYFKKLATSLQQGNLKPKQWWKIKKQFLKQNKDTDIPVIIHNGSQYHSPTEKGKHLK